MNSPRRRNFQNDFKTTSLLHDPTERCSELLSNSIDETFGKVDLDTEINQQPYPPNHWLVRTTPPMCRPCFVGKMGASLKLMIARH